ncbi:MAG: serine/threonine-protein kinase, partial [Planctomycetota bacterium]
MAEDGALHIVEQLAERYFTRIRDGEQLTPAEFAANFPDHEITLRNFIDAMRLVRQVRDDQVSKPKLLAGEQIGRFQIISELGRGGMGVVYVAEDVRLGRKVAIKLLFGDAVRDQEWLVRFEREAKLTSSLNHPNILTVHEIGRDADRHFIATEFVDGTTLFEALQRESSTTNQMTHYATQLLSAVAAAHRAGIVHRDLKPENIMVRQDGLVKVLDFGLAKVETTPSTLDVAQHETTTSPGIVLGTVHYMSPEQARGLPVTTSSDIFSLGIVLYAMFSGRHPFAGETPSDVMAAIINQPPHPFPRSETVPRAL